MTLGEALIDIKIMVSDLKAAKSKLDGFFNNLEQNIDIVMLSLKTLRNSIKTVGDVKLGRVMGEFDSLKSDVNNADLEVKQLGDRLMDLPKKGKPLNAAFDGFKNDLNTVQADIKTACALMDKLAKKKGPRVKPPTGGSEANPTGPDFSKFSQFGNKAREIGFALRDVGRQAIIAGAAISLMFAPIIKEGAEFEQSVKNVASVISGLTDGSELAKQRISELSDTFIELGETTEFTSTQIGDAARELALSGFSDQEIKDSIGSIVSLASATNTELDKTALIAARITRAFGISATSIKDVGDTLAIVASNSNTTLESLGESFKLASPIAAAYGQSVESIAAAFGVLGDRGISASRAGTSLSRLFSELTEKQDDIDEFLKSVGSSFDEIDPTKVDFLTEGVRELQRLSNAGLIDASDIFEQFDQRSARGLQSLISAGSGPIDNLTGKLEEAAGAAERIRDFRVDTISGSFKILKSAITTTAISITKTLEPTIRRLLSFFTVVTNSITDFVKNNQTFISGLAQVTVVAGGLTAVAGVILTIVGSMAALAGAAAFVIPILITIFTTLSSISVVSLAPVLAALAPVLGVLTLMAAAAAAVGFGLKSMYDEARNPLSELNDGNLAFIQNMERLDNVIKKTEQRLRDFRKQGELLKNLATLNPVQLDELIELSGDNNLLGDTGIKDEAEQKLRELQEVTRQEIELLPKTDQGFFDAFNPTKLAEIANAEDEIAKLAEKRLELEKQFDELADASFGRQDATGRLKQGNFIDQEFDVKRQLRAVDAAIKEQDEIRASTDSSDIRKAADQKVSDLQKTKNALEQDIKDIIAQSEGFGEELQKLISDQAEGVISEQAFREGLKALAVKNKDDQNILSKLKENEDKIKEFFDKPNIELTDEQNQLVNQIEKRQAEVEEALRQEKLALDIKLNQNKIRQSETSQRIGENQNIVEEEDPNSKEGEKAQKRIIELNKELSALKEGQVNINAAITKSEQNSADAIERKKEEYKELNRISRETQEQIIDDARLTVAEGIGDQNTIVEIFKKRAEATKQAALKEFDLTKQLNASGEVIDNVAEKAALRVKLQEDLNKATDIEIRKMLGILDITEKIAKIQNDLDSDLKTKEENDLNKARDADKKRQKNLDEDIKSLKALGNSLNEELNSVDFDAKLTEDEKSTRKKDLKDQIKQNLIDLDAAQKAKLKSTANLGRKEKKIRETEAEKRLKFTEDTALKQAQIDEDIETEFAIKKAQAKRKIEKDVEATSLSAADKQTQLQQRLDQSEIELEEQKQKKILEARKKAQSGDSGKDTIQTKRASVEKSIADSLAGQVKSLRDARSLLVFLARLEQQRLVTARSTANRLLKSESDLSRLRSKRQAAVAAGQDTTDIDQRIASRQINVELLRGKAEGDFGNTGARFGKLNGILTELNNNIKENKARLPVTGLPNLKLPDRNRGLGNTRVTIQNINIDGEGLDAQEVAALIPQGISDFFRNNPLGTI